MAYKMSFVVTGFDDQGKIGYDSKNLSIDNQGIVYKGGKEIPRPYYATIVVDGKIVYSTRKEKS